MSYVVAMIEIEGALRRLDRRGHVAPATLELALRDGEWVAMIVADPMPGPIVGRGPRVRDALENLAAELAVVDWRRLRGRRRAAPRR